MRAALRRLLPPLRPQPASISIMSAHPPLFRRGQPLDWILDWDGTITAKDTLDALVHISAALKPDLPTTDHWNRVSEAYMDDYSATLKQLVPDGVLPSKIQDEKRLLRQMRDVEVRSLRRVSLSGVFAGLTRQVIEQGAGQAIQSGRVQLRTGFPSFHKHVQGGESQTLSILSVNWSRHFIRSCLGAAGVTVPCDAIVSNELESIASGEASDGRIMPAATADKSLIVSSGDKLQRLEQMQETTAPKVYIGDSWTDIESLLAADLGICIRDDPMGSSQRKLAEALERLSIPCPRLRDWEQNGEPSVVWVSDFGEIMGWIETW